MTSCWSLMMFELNSVVRESSVVTEVLIVTRHSIDSSLLSKVHDIKVVEFWPQRLILRPLILQSCVRIFSVNKSYFNNEFFLCLNMNKFAFAWIFLILDDLDETLNVIIILNIYTIICLKSVCRRSQTAGRNSCSIASGDVSN